jgi:O-antigen ligase
MVITSTLTVVLLVVHFVTRASCPRPAAANVARTHPAGWFLLPFLAYALVNVIWISPVTWLGWRDWFGWAQMIAVFWVVLNGVRSPAPQRLLFFVLVGLGLIGVLMACYQSFVNADWQMLGGPRGPYHGRGSGSFGMPNSLAGLLILVLPALAALSFRRSATAMERVWWGWLTLILAFGLVLTISRGAWLALALAVVGWPLWAVRGRWSRRIRIAGLVLASVAVIGGVIYAKSPEVRKRFTQLALDAGEITRPIIWRAAWSLFREQPLTGTGAGSFDVLFERYRPERFRDRTLWAHNDYLNTLSDYGLIGFSLFFGAAAIIGVRCARIRRDDKIRRRDWLDSPTVLAALGVGILAFVLQLALEFHFKIPALALGFAIICGLVIARRWPVEPALNARSLGSRVVLAVVAFSCVAGFTGFLLPKFRAENFRKHARDTLDGLARGPADADHYRGPLEDARNALIRAAALDSANGEVWADLAYAMALWSRVEPSLERELGQTAEEAAERALGCSRVCPEFWIRRGIARDLQTRWLEASGDFATAVKLAPHNAPMWYYYAQHLTRVHSARETAQAAVAFCLRLDPGNLPALALREHLAIGPKAP